MMRVCVYHIVHQLFKMNCTTGETSAGWLLPQCAADVADARCFHWSHKQTGWIIFTSVMLLTMCWEGCRHNIAAAVTPNEARSRWRSEGVLMECNNKLQKGCLSVLMITVTWGRSCDKRREFWPTLFGLFSSALGTKRTGILDFRQAKMAANICVCIHIQRVPLTETNKKKEFQISTWVLLWTENKLCFLQILIKITKTLGNMCSYFHWMVKNQWWWFCVNNYTTPSYWFCSNSCFCLWPCNWMKYWQPRLHLE